jgi:hypothetical protein
VSLVLRWNQARLEDLLNSPDGPVGRLIAELSGQAAAVARSAVRVRSVPGTRRTRAGRNSTAVPPGFTKASIRVHGPVTGSRGGLYGGVNAALVPTVFLEHDPDGAEQMDRQYPFLTTGLESLAGSP